MSKTATPYRLRIAALLAAATGLVTLGVGSLSAGPAAAAPTSALVFSVDGGTTWSANVNAAPGQTVIAREYYNNDTSANITGAQLTTTLPAGFTLVGGSTETCLNPGTTDPTHPTGELECNTNTGGAAPNDEGGPIDENSVWTTNNLAISPTAGLFGQPTNATSGILAAGKVKYINLEQCNYANGVDLYTNTVQTTNNGGTFDAGTNASDTPSSLSCGAGGGGYTAQGINSAVQSIDLLGQQYVNLDQCEYSNGHNNYTTFLDDTSNSGGAFDDATSASNTAQSAVTCGAGANGYVDETLNSSVAPLNVLDNQYVNLDQCDYDNGTLNYTTMVDTTNLGGVFDTGTAATNTPQTSVTCGGGGNGYVLAAENSGLLALNTLDTTRGQGFVQWSMTAPSPATTTIYTEDGQLTGSGTGNPTTSGTITVNASIGTPLGNPWVLGGGLGALALACGAYVVIRRRRNGIEAS